MPRLRRNADSADNRRLLTVAQIDALNYIDRSRNRPLRYSTNTRPSNSSSHISRNNDPESNLRQVSSISVTSRRYRHLMGQLKRAGFIAEASVPITRPPPQPDSTSQDADDAGSSTTDSDTSSRSSDDSTSDDNSSGDDSSSNADVGGDSGAGGSRDNGVEEVDDYIANLLYDEDDEELERIENEARQQQHNPARQQHEALRNEDVAQDDNEDEYVYLIHIKIF